MSHIEIPGTASRLAREVRGTVDDLVRVTAKFDAIKAVMDQVAISSNWSNLADYLGFNEADADRETKAQAVYNLWGSANTEMGAQFLEQVRARLG